MDIPSPRPYKIMCITDAEMSHAASCCATRSTPRHKTNACRKNSWGIIFCANTCGACIRTHANTIILLRDHFPHISQILEGIHFGAKTCRTCIRTRANTGKYSWRMIYVLVLCHKEYCSDMYHIAYTVGTKTIQERKRKHINIKN